MKKLAAILLLTVLLFNWFGYRSMICFLEDKASAQLEAQLDENNYDESQLVSIKVPAIHLSYYANSKLFERVDGQIEIRGIQYKYVKRKLYNDSVELMCIPDHMAMMLQAAKNDFFKLVNDLQHKSSKKNGSDFSKNISSDYVTVNHLFKMNDLYFTTTNWMSYFKDKASFYFPSTIENPPENNPSELESI